MSRALAQRSRHSQEVKFQSDYGDTCVVWFLFHLESAFTPDSQFCILCSTQAAKWKPWRNRRRRHSLMTRTILSYLAILLMGAVTASADQIVSLGFNDLQ